MPSRKSRPSPEPELTASDDRIAFVEMFDAHAAHLYDYCYSLLASEAEAAAATRVTLIAAHALGGRLKDVVEARGWLFALARRECLSENPTRHQAWVQSTRHGSHGGGAPAGAAPPGAAASPAVAPESMPSASSARRDLADDDTGEITVVLGFGAEIRRAMRLRSRPQPTQADRYKEVLDLVHRHGIAPGDLGEILGIPADAAQGLLASAPVMATRGMAPRSLGRPVAGPAAEAERAWREGVEQRSSRPLARMPSSVWRDSASVVFDPEQSEYRQAIAADAGRLWTDGFPEPPEEKTASSGRKLALTSVGLAAVLLAPAAAGAGLYTYYVAAPHHAAAKVRDYTLTQPSPSPDPSTSAPGTAAAHAHTRARAHHATSKATSTGTSQGSQPVTLPPHSPTAKTSTPPVIKSGPSPTPTLKSHSTSPSPSPTSHSTSPSPSSSSPTSSSTSPASSSQSPSPGPSHLT